jgi:LuxR family transcriptional regulator, maltose regulon positive regulatory protein
MRVLVAMAHGEWDRAEVLAGQARTVVRQAGIEESHVTPLVYAVQARTVIHRGEVASARQALVSAQRGRPLLTYAIPHMAVQARIELIRVHIALGDLAGARTLMREIEGLLRRRPDLGTLVGETQALRAQLSAERFSDLAGASSLTVAELRLLPMLATRLSGPEIAAELFPNTIKSQQVSLPEAGGFLTRSGGRTSP